MRKKSLLVDLTPLLDVILILLFLVLAARTGAQKEETARLEEKIETLEKTQAPANDSEREWMLSFVEDTAKIHVIYPEDPKSDPVRIITGDGKLQRKPLTADFEAWLTGLVDKLPGKVLFVAFTYADDSILYRDYLNTRKILTELGEKTGKTVVYREEKLPENSIVEKEKP